jgi:predicted N-formylglutamate amidohydrolase
VKTKLVLSCEHAGVRVPSRYKKLFKSRQWLLKTHRGSDPGAYDIAKALSRSLGLRLFANTYTRLLVDVNRTLDQETLFSTVTEGLSEAEKKKVLSQFYWPYRLGLSRYIRKVLKTSDVLHVSIHSFTPKMKGVSRSCEIGILFKKSDRRAALYAHALQKRIWEENPKLKVRLNYPYDAEAGGISSAISEDLGLKLSKSYSAIYIEVNQKVAKQRSKEIARILARAISLI